MVETLCKGYFSKLELSNNIRSLLIKDLDLFVMSLALKMNANLSILRENVMKLDQMFDWGFALYVGHVLNGNYCNAIL